MASRKTNDKNDYGGVPAYRKIEDDIRLKVSDGRLPEGAMLASRHNLAKEYGVALSTAQRAIANLIADGILESLDRRGTFVARKMPAVTWTHGGITAISANTSAIPSQQLQHNFRYAGPVRRPKAAPAKLGIITTSRIESNAPRDIGSLWARLAIRSIEQAFSVDGGTTQFLDRFPERLGPYSVGFGDTNAVSIADALQALVTDGVDALAIVGLCDARDVSDEVVAGVDVERIPTVYISWHEIRPPLAQVYYDNRYAGYQAAQHLLNVGYRRLTFLAPFSGSWVSERIEGARDAIRHAGGPHEMLRVFPSEAAPGAYIHDNTSQIAYATAIKAFDAIDFLAGGDTGEPWGIIAPNDHAAFAILEAASERGRAPGIEFGLVGFDDDPMSCAVGLTTIRPPVEAMGEAAAKLLLRAIGGERGSSHVRLRSHLIQRSSTSRRPRTTLRHLSKDIV